MTPVVNLRAIEPEDLDLLYGIENDVRLWNVGTTNVPYSRYTLHDYIATSADDIYADRQVRLIVEDADHEPVGLVDLVRFEPQHLRAEVGIVILDAFRRRGYATAAVESLAAYAQQVLHLHQLYAIAAVNNEAAVNLFLKAGFCRQGVLTDWLSDGNSYMGAVLLQRFL
ncbi:MAG: GNAT family N-acetyltransferase [Prevotella sp.]|nr:GNAT family N-acetyltransferase [Prevotella sp.]